MKDSVRQAYDATRTFDSKAFRSGCYAPFVSLYFTSLGDVLACCKNETSVLGNVRKHRLEDIWKGRKAATLRKALADYRFEAGCELCEWEIEGKNYDHAFPRIFEEFPVQSMEPDWPSMIEFAGSNTCNFECVMCNGLLSSSIRARRDGLPPLPKAYSDQFFEDLRQFLPHLQRAKFLGGEPFLAHECFRIWDMMIEDGLSTPSHVTTNGSQYNAKVERVLEALPISLSISIDGATKETVEKIRVNAHHEELIDHVRRFREYTRRRGTHLSLTYCLMRLNWHEFGDFLLFAESLDCPVWINTVISPSHCSLFTLPPEDLSHIADEMEKQDASLNGKLRLNRQVWKDTVLKVRNNANDLQVKGLANVKHAALEAWQSSAEEIRNHVAAAWDLVYKGRYPEALEEARKTPQNHPCYYHSLFLSGHIRCLLGDMEGAESDLDRALKMSRRRPEAFIYRAWLRFNQGRLKEGVEDALRARELTKQGDELERNVCDVLGFLYTRQGKLSEARQEMDRLLALQPESPLARVQRAQAFLIAGSHAKASDEIEAALAIQPNFKEAFRVKEYLGSDSLESGNPPPVRPWPMSFKL